jgi:uncharacterized protein YbjT (DUF2867 family)
MAGYPIIMSIACVIGATGVVGRELVDLLLDDNRFEKVIVFARRELPQHDKLEQYKIDFKKIPEIADKVKGDYFFSCLGTTKKLAGSIAAQYIVDHDYQWEFAKIAHKNGIPNYMLISSPGANSHSISPYLKMKGELDDKIRSLDFESKLLIKPSMIVGSRSDNRIGEKVGIVIGNALKNLPGAKRYEPIRGKTIAKAMIQIALSHKSKELKSYELDCLFNYAKAYEDTSE